MYNPIKTLKTNTIGTLNMLGEYYPKIKILSSVTKTPSCHFTHIRLLFIFKTQKNFFNEILEIYVPPMIVHFTKIMTLWSISCVIHMKYSCLFQFWRKYLIKAFIHIHINVDQFTYIEHIKYHPYLLDAQEILVWLWITNLIGSWKSSKHISASVFSILCAMFMYVD